MLVAAPLSFERPPPLPVAQMVVGKDVNTLVALLPRLFNLCRSAQVIAARQALGMPVDRADRDALLLEVRRDHLMKLCMGWPGRLGMGQIALPPNWQTDPEATLAGVFGPDWSSVIETRSFDDFAQGPAGLVLRRIQDAFAPGEACTSVMPAVSSDTALSADAAVENSVAVRHLAHPVMRDVEQRYGCGPLWRATARALDLIDTLTGRFLLLTRAQPGRASVAATRGLYTIEARVAGGNVTEFRRVTPTDHLLAKRGILEQSLASLPEAKRGLAGLVLDILDPCSPVKIRGAGHA